MKIIVTTLLLISLGVVYFFMDSPESDVSAVDSNINIGFSNKELKEKSLESISHYNAIIEKPLFIEDREFEKEEEVKIVRKPKPVIEDLKVKALGVALTSDGLLAVIVDLKNSKNLRLRIGDKIYGWRLDGVSESSFTFSKDGKEKVIAYKD